VRVFNVFGVVVVVVVVVEEDVPCCYWSKFYELEYPRHEMERSQKKPQQRKYTITLIFCSDYRNFLKLGICNE
jgi:hypothetical protein